MQEATMKRFIPLAAVLLSGCVIETTGPTQHETRSIDLDSSEYVTVNLKMGAGVLRVQGGSPKLAEASFTYNVPSWKPYVRYSSTAGHGDLDIEQPGSSHSHIGSQKYEWDLRLNNHVPVDLRMHFGAGEGHLDLRDVTVRGVDLDMGVGEVDVDLRGHPTRDYDVRIRGGIGQATVRLPNSVGIYARGSGGIGEVKADGLRREGDHWVNDAYDRAKVKIHVDVQGGIGQINLIAE